MPEAQISPAHFRRFEFTGQHFDPHSGQLRLGWCWNALRDADPEIADTYPFEEIFRFPSVNPLSDARRNALESALNLLHWVAGVSYWKIACQGEIAFSNPPPDAWQSKSLVDIYRHGLAELAWRNRLQQPYWPDFEGFCVRDLKPAASPEGAVSASVVGLSNRVLVALGGGKDSLVAVERVRSAGFEPITVQIGQAALIAKTAAAAGTEHRVIQRVLSPRLAALNNAGAINGHVPITAINSAALVIAALLWDCDTVVFANERSADTPTLIHEGQSINHQFAKSFAFEQLLGAWLQRYVAGDLRVFSILRRDSELAVCREFSGLTHYHDVFSSCNRNFHLGGPRTSRWCGHCPKCLFVYLALAPFMVPERMRSIFGRDLLAEPGLTEGFAELLELDGHRPFECVGEAEEARAAVRMLAESDDWNTHAVVRSLHQRMNERLNDRDGPAPSKLLQASGPHRIPAEFLK